jgi:hypothetical protein
VAASDYLTVGSTPSNLIQNTTLTQNATINISGTITSGCRAGFTPIAGGRLCVGAIQPAAPYFGAQGALQACVNQGTRIGGTADVTLTLSTGMNYFNGVNQGWLGDFTGTSPDLRLTWSAASPVLSFEGPVVNVTGSPAPTFPYRCVY